jgi:uncharacterized integral membrane protein
MQFFLILALLIAILAVFFAIQNTIMVTVYFFFWQISSSLAVILLCTLAIGVLISMLFSIPAIQKRNWQINKHKRRITDLDHQKATQAEEIADHIVRINTLREQVITLETMVSDLEEKKKNPVQTPQPKEE